MMKPPEIYGEWIPLLERFAEGKDDREVLPAMQAGKLPCFRIVLERFPARLDAAMEKRFERLVGEFQAQGAMQTPDQAEQMIRGLRDGLGSQPSPCPVCRNPSGTSSQQRSRKGRTGSRPAWKLRLPRITAGCCSISCSCIR